MQDTSNGNISDETSSPISPPEVPPTPPSPADTSNGGDPNSNPEEKEKGNKDTQNGNGVDSDKLLIKNFKGLPEEEKKTLIDEDEERRRKLEQQRAMDEEMEYEKARKRIEEARKKKKEEQKWKEDMFWRVYHLVRHSGDRTVEDFMHRTIMACFMLKAVAKTKYFDEFKASGVGEFREMVYPLFFFV